MLKIPQEPLSYSLKLVIKYTGLKRLNKKYAIHCNCNNGPTFGEGPALSIAGNFVEGHSKLGKSY
jgi:hypothetical protein